MAGSDAQKSSNKPISEYFPKRAPSSPVRGGTKSPLSFGSMYPQSPKTSYVASSPSGNASNGPMSYNQGDYYQQHPQQPGDYLLKSLQVILFEIDWAIFYTNLHELFCQYISWTNWVNSGKFMDNCWISCQVMADMKKVYDNIIIINL